MIEHLSGVLLFREGDHLIVDSGGLGCGVEVPSGLADALGPLGATVELWTYHHVTESSQTLYGFARRGEREAFAALTAVSGVGPRIALSILSTLAIEDLIDIVMKGDARALTRVPGIGHKKAEKLLVELKDRVDRLSAGLEPDRRRALAPEAARLAAAEPPLPTEAARMAASALEALDLQPTVSRRAIARALEALGEQASVEDLVREGLRHRLAV